MVQRLQPTHLLQVSTYDDDPKKTLLRSVGFSNSIFFEAINLNREPKQMGTAEPLHHPCILK